MFHRIVHANDGSTNAMSALHAAIDLASLAKARLDVLLVEEISPRSGTIGEVAERDAAQHRLLARRKALVEQAGEQQGVVIGTHIFVGYPVKHIVQFTIERNADLLVIGATEHTDLWEHLFGRRSDRMTHMVGCSVLIVREGGHDAP